MPIGDASQYLWDAAASVAAGTSVRTGPGPLKGMLLRSNLLGGTSADFDIQESDDDTNWFQVEQGNLGTTQQILAGKTTEQRIWWSKRYLRANVSAQVGDGVLNISLVHGNYPQPEEGATI